MTPGPTWTSDPTGSSGSRCGTRRSRSSNRSASAAGWLLHPASIARGLPALRATGSGLEAQLVQPGLRVDRGVDVAGGGARGVDLEVQVRPEGTAGHAHVAELIAAGDALAHLDRDRRHVRVEGLRAVRVLDH